MVLVLAAREVGMGRVTRAQAQELLFEFTRSDALRKHGRAVEEAMRAYAGWFGVRDPDEVETWGIVGMLLGVVIDSLLGTVRFQAQRWGYECGPH